MRNNCYCLLSSIQSGQILSLSELTDSIENYILYIDQISVPIVQKIFERKLLPKAVITPNGSFAGHPSVLLNSKAIQLCIVKEKPIKKYCLINGEEEYIEYNDTPISYKVEDEQFDLDEINTKDVSVNVDGKNAEELVLGINNGADGIGILRTDWIGWDQYAPPTIEEHFSVYNEALNGVGNKILNIRLFDIGGDKIPRWAESVKEEIKSPIGYRGIRARNILSQAFNNQLIAIGELGKKYELGIVIPMITTAQEITDIKDCFRRVTGNKGTNIRWGAMIETPSSALLSNDILDVSDFLRIGPGDLTQFTIATLRDNIHPEDLSGSSINDSVKKLIEISVENAKRRDKEINMCLDVEPRKPLLKSLIDIGVYSFNVSPNNIRTTKLRIDNLLNN